MKAWKIHKASALPQQDSDQLKVQFHALKKNPKEEEDKRIGNKRLNKMDIKF